jgi:uncharacterized protein YndB with AHSA1/START domain
VTEPDLRLRAVVPAAPKVVYEALTDPAALRRYHELPQWRSIWRHIEIAGVPEGMFSIGQ